ncbi:DDB1- and CUL4-associated factor 10 like protein [Trachymyrmex cornetzi]|uniref:DDB1-and CUL4-associated factor 10 like protein n=1 Tax=Trachymyrmex cornetzi TaxID=471704 RepID=A0A151JCI8_9HYME|nr:DDB1- and CUL4-associated factor 10 like protein [Trachymyrmex cornetzi]
MPKIRIKQTPNSLWLRQRELGVKFPLGHSDDFHKTLYSSIQPITSWDHGDNLTAARHGGVFNLEYSPDGSLLLAACEKKSILMFDPLCRKLIHAIDNAHSDCVNCVRFLDQRMFATCSDDSTVALWDARNLKQRIRTLQGHSNWVKNIEYSPSDSLLLTSGFDGSIYTWDINSFTENSFVYNRVFHTNGLMRTRLTPDTSKMLICTTSGYLIIIHNLKLSTLSQDLAGFKPNMYRLMQLSQTTIPVAASYTHLFAHTRTHNRVEFLTDFPIGDDAEVISSLQVHPQGWCALSRNVSSGEKSEWTCIHDIQEREASSNMEQVNEGEEGRLTSLNVEEFEDFPQSQSSRSSMTSSFVIENGNRARIVHDVSDVRSNSFDSPVRVSTDAAPSSIRSSRTSWQLNDLRRRNMIDNFTSGNVELHVSTTDVWEALVAIREARLRRERERQFYPGAERRDWLPRSNNGVSVNLPRSSHTVVIIGDRTRVQNLQNRQNLQTMYAIPRNHKIHQNTPRLTHYIEEPNVGSGYIKELCFSADGRLICSPFGYGVRLLAFSSDCTELSNCVPPANESVQLHELATHIGHSDIVVSTKFSPKHYLLVSGCLSGKIIWHQPVV